MAEGTPSDLEAVIVDTMASIEKALPGYAACLDELTISHAWELGNRAEYHLDSRTIVLRVPATADHLEHSLTHEVAHHLDFHCGVSDETREAFAVAQNIDPTMPWEQSESWASTPAELFATAVALHVTGRSDPLRRLDITDEALAVVTRWAMDEGMTG